MKIKNLLGPALLLSTTLTACVPGDYTTNNYPPPGRYPNQGYGNSGYGGYGGRYDPYPNNQYPDYRYPDSRYPDYRDDHRHRDRDYDHRDHDHRHRDDHRRDDDRSRGADFGTRPPAPPPPAPPVIRPNCPSGTRFDGRHCIITDSSLKRPGGDGKINPCPKGMWVSGDKCVGN